MGVWFWGGSGPGGCLFLGGFLLWGGSGPGGVSAPGGVVSQHALRQTPPVNRMTNRCKNITLATTSLRPVKIKNLCRCRQLRTDPKNPRQVNLVTPDTFLHRFFFCAAKH